VYDIACHYDLLILEDDPYFYLYFGESPAPSSGQEHLFKRPHLTSLWSLDEQGRVIRFDSLSKVLSSGIRLGFATGPSALIDRMCLHTQATSLHASGISQILALKLFNLWGEQGWRKHTNEVSLFYMKKRDQFIRMANKHLTGLAEWNVPTAGMFIWLKLNGYTDTQQFIQKKALEAKVLLVPGQSFSPNNEKSPYVRASFSLASEEEMDLALGRLAKLLREK